MQDKTWFFFGGGEIISENIIFQVAAIINAAWVFFHPSCFAVLRQKSKYVILCWPGGLVLIIEKLQDFKYGEDNLQNSQPVEVLFLLNLACNGSPYLLRMSASTED